MTRFVSSLRGRVFDHAEDTFLLGSGGVAHRLSGDSAELIRAILAFLDRPRTQAEIALHLESLSEGPVERPEVIDEALALLEASGAIDRAPEPPAPASPLRGRLLLGVSGAVAAAGAPDLAARLLRAGFEVRVALTRNARSFVSPVVLEAITHQPVYRGVWQRDATCPVPHINLAEWADLVLICPASATTLSRMAGGDCSDLVSAITVATRAPILVVPSMNAAMYGSPQVTRNLSLLRESGCYVVNSGLGEELAHLPGQRIPAAGAAPSHAAVVEIACFVAAQRSRVDWDALYAAHPGQPPFCADRFDPDFGEALSARGIAGGRLLDVGTGIGTLAIELGRRGYAVTAVDVCSQAIERARNRPEASAIAWRVGDVLASDFDGPFDVIIDRGCLHLLPREAHRAWAAAMARLTAPGGWLLVKTCSVDASRPPGTHAFRPHDLASLLGNDFVMDATWETVFHGPDPRPPRALFSVLRRPAS